MTDSSLSDALQSAPENSILVLEDIDALFSTDRKSDSNAPLTFSGILNALDGLASPHGQIFALTTNHPEKLDPAMLRHGRVDLAAEFPAATAEQVGDMFQSFYPEARVEQCVQFSQKLKEKWGQLNLAGLQDFFIQNRERTATEALDQVEAWLKAQQESKEAQEAFERANKEKKKARERDQDDGGDKDDDDNNKGNNAQADSAPPTVSSKSVKSSRRKKGGSSGSKNELYVFAAGLLAAAAISVLIHNKQ